MKKLVLYVFMLCVPFIGISQTESNEQSNKWEWNVTPYLWLAGTSGDVIASEVNGGNGTVGISLSDALDPLEATGMLDVKASKGNWSIMASAFLTDVKKEGILTHNYPGIDLGENGMLNTSQTYVELAGGYTFFKSKTLDLDFLLGGRYLSVCNDIAGENGNPVYEDDENFIDPFIGLGLSNYWGNFGITGRVGVGGFGIGSKVSYKYNLMVGYQFIELLEVKLGYQAYQPIYRSNNLEYNLSTEGFLLGLEFSF